MAAAIGETDMRIVRRGTCQGMTDVTGQAGADVVSMGAAICTAIGRRIEVAGVAVQPIAVTPEAVAIG